MSCVVLELSAIEKYDKTKKTKICFDYLNLITIKI